MLTARLSVYKMFVFLEVVAHRQLRYVVGEYLAPPVEQVDILVRVSILFIYTLGHDMVANKVAGKFHHRLVVVGGYVVNLSLLDVVVHLFGVTMCLVALDERHLTGEHIDVNAEMMRREASPEHLLFEWVYECYHTSLFSSFTGTQYAEEPKISKPSSSLMSIHSSLPINCCEAGHSTAR